MKNIQANITNEAHETLEEYKARTGKRTSEAVSELIIYGAVLARKITSPSPADLARAALDTGAKTREDC